MTSQTLFTVIEKSDSLLKDDIPVLKNRLVTLYSATKIQEYLPGEPGNILLCLDARNLETIDGRYRGVSVLKNIPDSVNCVSGLYELPVEIHGVSKLPAEYDQAYQIQMLEDLVDTIEPGISKQELEQMVDTILNSHQQNKGLSATEIAQILEKLLNQATFVSLSEKELTRIDQWLIDNWVVDDPQFNASISALILNCELPNSSIKFFQSSTNSDRDLLAFMREVEEEFL